MTATDGSDLSVAVESDTVAAAACLFHGFGDPSRLAILLHLSGGDYRVVDLAARVGLAPSTVSKHLACLKGCGLVTSRPVGRASVFSVARPRELQHLLASAERLLAVTSDAVTLCSNHGVDALKGAS